MIAQGQLHNDIRLSKESEKAGFIMSHLFQLNSISRAKLNNVLTSSDGTLCLITFLQLFIRFAFLEPRAC